MLNESHLLGDATKLSPAVQALFPAGVAAAETRMPGDAALLFPDERLYVQGAVDKRVREFAAGRACARRALAEFGIFDFKLLPAPDRQPIWPLSMVGSITHTTGYCVAVAAARDRIAAIGIDTERIETVGRDLWATIACPAELRWCMSLPEPEHPAAMTLLFSAKEAFYKCQYPLTAEWLDFHDLRIEPIPGDASNAFRVHFNRALKIQNFLDGPAIGRYITRDGLLTSGIAVTGS